VPHVTMLVQPLTNSAMPGKPEKKRGCGRPKGSKTKSGLSSLLVLVLSVYEGALSH